MHTPAHGPGSGVFCLLTRNDSRVNEGLLVFGLLHLWAFRHGFAAGIRNLEARFSSLSGIRRESTLASGVLHWAIVFPPFIHLGFRTYAVRQAGRKVRRGGGRGKDIMAFGGASVWHYHHHTRGEHQLRQGSLLRSLGIQLEFWQRLHGFQQQAAQGR